MDIDLILDILGEVIAPLLMVGGGIGVIFTFLSFMKIFADRADEILEELKKIKEKLDKND